MMPDGVAGIILVDEVALYELDYPRDGLCSAESSSVPKIIPTVGRKEHTTQSEEPPKAFLCPISKVNEPLLFLPGA